MSSLSSVIKGIEGGWLKAQLLKARLMKGLREGNVERQRLRYEKDDRSVVHVANLLGGEDFCARKAYYAHVEGEVGFTLNSDRTLMTFYEGDQTELQFKDLMRKAQIPLLVPKQKKLVDKIVGTPDVMFLWMKRVVIGEVKSMHARAWRALEAPTERFIQQIGTYMGLYKGETYPDGVVAVKGKGLDEWKFFWLEWAEVKKQAARVIKRGLAVHDAILTGELPARILGAKLTHKVCAKCAFKEMCLLRDSRR